MATFTRRFSSSPDRYVEAGDAGLPNTFVKPNNRDFAPRLGALTGSTPDFVVRGGFGIYYVDYTINEFRNSINVAPFVRRAQLTRSLLLSQNVNVNSSIPSRIRRRTAAPPAPTRSSPRSTASNPDYPTMRLYSWNLTIEKDLGCGTGSAIELRRQHRPQSVAERARERVPARSDRVPVTRGQRSDGTQVAAIWARCRPARRRWRSNYNAWEIELQKRFSNGLLFDVNYAWARASTSVSGERSGSESAWRYDYGPVPAQPKSVFHWNYVYELPFGRGKRWGFGIRIVLRCLAAGSCRASARGSPALPDSDWREWGRVPPAPPPIAPTASPTASVDHDGLSRGEKAFQWFDTAALTGCRHS